MSSYKWIENLLSAWGNELLDCTSRKEVNVLGKIQDFGLVGAAIRSTNSYSVTPELELYTKKVSKALTKLPESDRKLVIDRYLYKRNLPTRQLAKEHSITLDRLNLILERSYRSLWDDLKEFRRDFEG
jgi:hypothetical protein